MPQFKLATDKLTIKTFLIAPYLLALSFIFHSLTLASHNVVLQKSVLGRHMLTLTVNCILQIKPVL